MATKRVNPIAIAVLKPHLSVLAVDNHGMTAVAVGGGTFLAYLFVYYLQILKFDDEISFPLQIHNLRYNFPWGLYF